MIDAQGVTWEPFIATVDGEEIAGFRATHPDGRVERVYLQPSTDDSEGVSNVFLYHDEADPVTWVAVFTS